MLNQQSSRYQTLDIEGQENDTLTGKRTPGISRRKLVYILYFLCFAVGVLLIVTIIQSSRMNKFQKNENKAQQLFFNSSLLFFVVGDWGRQNNDNQKSVAEAMSELAKEQPPQFIISTGDNFYPSGLSSFKDKLFQESFIDAYNQPSLENIPWYAVLGNHDYGDGRENSVNQTCGQVNLKECSSIPVITDSQNKGETFSSVCCNSPNWQFGQELKARDERWNCKRQQSMTFGENWIDMFFIDTTPMVPEYYNETWSSNPGGLLSSNPYADLLELQTSLADSKAQWKIVVGHHPVRSNGAHGEQDGIRELLEPTFTKYKVNLYLNGHDHNLQYIYNQANFTRYITSGAGSNPDNEFASNQTDSLYSYGSPGFVSIELQQNQMMVKFLGTESSKQLFEDTIQAE